MTPDPIRLAQLCMTVFKIKTQNMEDVFNELAADMHSVIVMAQLTLMTKYDGNMWLYTIQLNKELFYLK